MILNLQRAATVVENIGPCMWVGFKLFYFCLSASSFHELLTEKQITIRNSMLYQSLHYLVHVLAINIAIFFER